MAGTRQVTPSIGDMVKSLLREEGAHAFDAAVGRLAQGTGEALARVTDRLTDVAENDGKLFPPRPSRGVGGLPAIAALTGLGESAVKGILPGKAKDAAKGLAGGKAKDVKDKVAGAAGSSSAESSSGDGLKPGDPKVTSIIEVLDIGVPLRTVYDFWTEYEEFGDIVKGVQSVTKDDDVTSKWKVKIAFSNRSFEATVQEQIPDERIAWTSEGSKGSTNGAVTFHDLGPSLTRIVVVVEYYPSGFFEKTGNLWRAQGRRLRLDLKHFQRYVTLTEEEPEAWRGEIHDGEVVRTDEEVRDAEAEDDDREGREEYDDDWDDDEVDEDEDEDEEAAEDEEEGYDEDEDDEEDESDEDEKAAAR